MNDFVKRYRSGQQEISTTMKAWQVFGAGLENFGCNEQPVEIEVPQPGPRELLARVDAAGLCFSDVKILRLGGEHPRLYGRDLATDPIIPGHEAALTIVKVGSDIADQFNVGDRFVVQADIFYQGVNLAFGYMLPGALEQYVLLGGCICFRSSRRPAMLRLRCRSRGPVSFMLIVLTSGADLPRAEWPGLSAVKNPKSTRWELWLRRKRAPIGYCTPEYLSSSAKNSRRQPRSGERSFRKCPALHPG